MHKSRPGEPSPIAMSGGRSSPAETAGHKQCSEGARWETGRKCCGRAATASAAADVTVQEKSCGRHGTSLRSQPSFFAGGWLCRQPRQMNHVGRGRRSWLETSQPSPTQDTLHQQQKSRPQSNPGLTQSDPVNPTRRIQKGDRTAAGEQGIWSESRSRDL